MRSSRSRWSFHPTAGVLSRRGNDIEADTQLCHVRAEAEIRVGIRDPEARREAWNRLSLWGLQNEPTPLTL